MNEVTSNIKDHQCGDCYLSRNQDRTVKLAQDKMGAWKGPYHNSRAGIEIKQRLDEYHVPKLEQTVEGKEVSV